MKKFLLSLVALVALTVNAATQMDMTELGSGWSSTYDADTQSITYEGAWAGRGWWLSAVDYSDYAGVLVVFRSATANYYQLQMEYNDADNASVALSASGDVTTDQMLVGALDTTGKSSVKQIYVQNGSDLSVVYIVAAVLLDEDELVAAQAGTFDYSEFAFYLDSYDTGDDDADDDDEATADDSTGSVGDGTSYTFNIDSYPWNYSAVISQGALVSYNSQWGEYPLTSIAGSIDTDEYVSITVNVASVSVDEEGESQLQVKLEYTTDTDSNCYPALVEGENVIDFIEGDVVSALNAQAKEAGATLQLESVYLNKADGTSELMSTTTGSGWGHSVIPTSPCDIIYTGQWGGVYLLICDTWQTATYTYGEDEGVIFTIELAEASPMPFMVELDNAAEGFEWFNFEAGETTYEFGISDRVIEARDAANVAGGGDEVADKNVAKIYIKSNDSDSSYYPGTLQFVSITSVADPDQTWVSPTESGIENIAVSTSVKNAIYNLAGQRVNSATKGLYIINGKKVVK